MTYRSYSESRAEFSSALLNHMGSSHWTVPHSNSPTLLLPSVKFLLLPHPHPADGHYIVQWNTGRYNAAKPQKPRLHNITMDLREIDCDDEWSHLAQGSVAGSSDHSSEPSGSINTGNFFSSWATTTVSRKILLHVGGSSGSARTTGIYISELAYTVHWIHQVLYYSLL